MQFTVKVDAELLKLANGKRSRTWRELTEEMLRAVVELSTKPK